MKSKQLWLLTGTALGLHAVSGAAWAQDARPGHEAQLEELVVTAQRSAESLQDVPLAVSAFGERELEEAHIYQAQDLQTRVPGLFYGKFGSTNAQIALRGVGNLNQSIGGEQGVAVIRDGVVLGRPGAAANQLFDVERIEVLRGPQGTLYGRNTTGGVINIITHAPELDDFSGAGDLLLASYRQVRVRGAVNLPVRDDLALRVSFLSDNRDGYGRNLFSGTDLNDEDFQAARVQLLYQPTERLEVRLIAEGFTQDTGGSRIGFGIPQPGVTPTPAPFPDDPRDNVRNHPEYSRNLGSSLVAVVRYDGGPVEITSTTAYVRTRFDALVDYDASEVPWSWIRRKDPGFQLSQELQFTSNDALDGRLRWVGGLFAFHEDVNTYATFQVNPSIFIEAHGRVKTDSIAAYGQGSFDISPALTATVGLRYTIDHKTGFEHNLYTPTPGAPYAAEGHFKDTWRSFTPKFGLEYNVSDDVMLYASVTKGFQSGGYNISAIQGRGYDPESLWAYEAGAKGSFLERRLQINAAAFYYDYKDIISQNRLPGYALTFIENAASATVKGLELEVAAAPTANVRLGVTAGYLDARYEKYSSQDPDRGFTLFNLKGNRLPFAPKWNLAANAQWSVLVADGELTLRAEHRWQSRVYFSQFNVPIASQSPYGKTNLRATYAPMDGRWDVEVFVENLEDELTRSNILVQRGQAHATTWYDAPRTIGVRLGYRL